jgi:hypothetical protein
VAGASAIDGKTGSSNRDSGNRDGVKARSGDRVLERDTAAGCRKETSAVSTNFEITHLQSNADVEYVEDKPVLHKYMDITIRVYKGFDWKDPKMVNALFKRLEKAESMNDE